ncbi:MAG: hypothetical protein AAGL89_08380 [Pseudomonadota bacterium]
MSEVLTILLVLYVPTLLVCGAFFGAGHAVTHVSLGRWLRRSAAFWLIVLWAAFTLALVIEATCGGNLIYGFDNCRIFSDDTSGHLVWLTVFVTLLGMIYGAVLAVFGAITEWLHRRANTARETPRRSG